MFLSFFPEIVRYDLCDFADVSTCPSDPEIRKPVSPAPPIRGRLATPTKWDERCWVEIKRCYLKISIAYFQKCMTQNGPVQHRSSGSSMLTRTAENLWYRTDQTGNTKTSIFKIWCWAVKGLAQHSWQPAWCNQQLWGIKSPKFHGSS